MANLKKSKDDIEVTNVDVKDEKKVAKKNEKEVEVEVKDTVDNQEVEVEVETVEVEIPENSGVEIDTENTKVDTAKKPDGFVKIRMRIDHKCYVGDTMYDLKKGQTYTVPHSVKLRLNKAGLLLPL